MMRPLMSECDKIRIPLENIVQYGGGVLYRQKIVLFSEFCYNNRMKKNTIPLRSEVPASDKWDLSTLYTSDEEWEKALSSINMLTEKVVAFKGKLADSSDSLLGCLKANEALEKVIETVYNYASLQHTADESDSDAQNREGRASMAYAKSQAQTSFFTPELMEIPDETLKTWIEGEDFADYKIFIKKLLHEKTHILSEKEEKILSLQSESAQTAQNTFSLLSNVDMEFGSVNDGTQEIPLTQSTFSLLIRNNDRKVRQQAYKQFYATFEKHKNTLASLYAGSVNTDVF